MTNRKYEEIFSRSTVELGITSNDIYTLCNRHQWFTNGNNTQYDFLFDMMGDSDCGTAGYTLRDVAIAIRVCSLNWSVRQIEEELFNLVNTKRVQKIEGWILDEFYKLPELTYGIETNFLFQKASEKGFYQSDVSKALSNLNIQAKVNHSSNGDIAYNAFKLPKELLNA